MVRHRISKRSPRFDPVVQAVGRLAQSLQGIDRRVDELHGLDRCLDRALDYNAHPGANTVLARAYVEHILKHRAEAVARLRAEREHARMIIAETDHLLGDLN
jgi:hypothetical protein